MELQNEYKYLVGGYYGVREMDEYDLKVYVLKDIELYIRNFIETNPISNFNYRVEAKKIEEELSLKTKLQDSLLVLNKINGPTKLITMIKQRIQKMQHHDYEE